jgi:hypothetical protein
MDTAEQIILKTRKWITDVIAGCNFCPFVSKELKQNSIYYKVEDSAHMNVCLQSFSNECKRLSEESIETTLLIFSNGFKQFDDYLELVANAEKLLKKEGYEGVYQVAGFHPKYTFAAVAAEDPANYTNRSVYPMLHLLREDSVEKALSKYPNPEQIPERNILFARSKGIEYMKTLRNACL